jgi:hypothetical protein
MVRALNPNPAFQVNLDLDTDPEPKRIHGFDDQKLKKKIQQKIVFLIFFIKNYNLLASKKEEKPSVLQREHQAL